MRETFSGPAPTFVLVGTFLNPQGRTIALAAFERLWARHGRKARLRRRRGWHVETVMARVTRSPEYGRRLFWFENADDTDLAFAYDHCAAVLAPAYAEGFGLPLVETARKGKPVICSDIPVFREVGATALSTSASTIPDAMAQAIPLLHRGRRESRSGARDPPPTWRVRPSSSSMSSCARWMRRLP